MGDMREIAEYKKCIANYKAMHKAYEAKMAHWRASELKRKSALAEARIDKKSVDSRLHTFNSASGKIAKATKHRDDKMVTFPGSLKTEIDAYASGLASIVKLKNAQTEKENQDAIARNKASSALAAKNMEHTKKRGVTNQKVKAMLIW